MQSWRSNSSEIVVRAFQERVSALPKSNLELTATVLPAESEQIQAIVEDLFANLRPDVCLFLGQARGRPQVTIEQFGTNILHLQDADACGLVCERRLIIEEGPPAYAANLYAQDILVDSLTARGIPARYSYAAGTSLCNQILYTALHKAKEVGSAARCGFVHLPILPQQAIDQWPESPFMPLDMQLEAIEIVLDCILAQSPGAE